MKKYRKSITMSNTIDELYEEYQNRTFGKAKYLRSKGITPKAINFISKDRFKAAWEKLVYRTDDEGNFLLNDKGNRVKVAKVSASSTIDKIVAKGLRTSSQKQAMNVAKESKIPGSKYSRQYTVLEAMYGGTIWEEVKEEYHNQIDKGFTSTEAKHYIAVTFFGSD